jgi:hypothetical protein
LPPEMRAIFAKAEADIPDPYHPAH